jgi:hypothetical protein
VLCASEAVEGFFHLKRACISRTMRGDLPGGIVKRTRIPCCFQVHPRSPTSGPSYRKLRLEVRLVTASGVPADGNLRTTRRISIHSNLIRRFPLTVLLCFPLRAYHRTDDGGKCTFRRPQTLDAIEGFQFRLACVCLLALSCLCPWI